jgi:hypothetical protein
VDLTRAVHLAARVDIIRLKDFLVSERSVRCFDLSSPITICAFLFMSRKVDLERCHGLLYELALLEKLLKDISPLIFDHPQLKQVSIAISEELIIECGRRIFIFIEHLFLIGRRDN